MNKNKIIICNTDEDCPSSKRRDQKSSRRASPVSGRAFPTPFPPPPPRRTGCVCNDLARGATHSFSFTSGHCGSAGVYQGKEECVCVCVVQHRVCQESVKPVGAGDVVYHDMLTFRERDVHAVIYELLVLHTHTHTQTPTHTH